MSEQFRPISTELQRQRQDNYRLLGLHVDRIILGAYVQYLEEVKQTELVLRGAASAIDYELRALSDEIQPDLEAAAEDQAYWTAMIESLPCNE